MKKLETKKTTKIKPWRKRTAAITKTLKEANASLSKLLIEATELRDSVNLQINLRPGDYQVRAVLRDAEHWASRIAGTATSLENILSLESERRQNERRVERALDICRSGYWQDVRDVAEDFAKEWNSGEYSDRDKALEALESTLDGHERVIYTSQAQDCLRHSENDGAYVDDFGTKGMIEDGCIQWSKLAFCAFRADVLEHLKSISVDTNDDPPAKIDDHPFKGGNSEACDHPLDEADEDGNATEATSEFCGRPKSLHKYQGI